jgi:small subunit ribosomal protein S1
MANQSNKELLKRFAVDSAQLDQAVAESMEDLGSTDMDSLYNDSVRDFTPNALVKGMVMRVVAEDLLVDIGFKSEGIVPLYEFDDDDVPEPGSELEVLMEGMDESSGLLLLSKRRAERVRGWEQIVQTHKEGDIIHGTATRKIKGGLLLDVGGVSVFLPASQIDIRRVPDVGAYISKELECKIIKIDRERMNVVVSRRKLLEERRNAMRQAARGAAQRHARRAALHARGGSDPQGHREEHRRLRRVPRHRRRGRTAAHHRHELGPGEPSQRGRGARADPRGEGVALRS